MPDAKTKKITKTKVVYILYTRSDRLPTPELLGVYSKTSYQKVYNRIADIAERHGEKVWSGHDKVAVTVISPMYGQAWWIERHEVK